MIMKQKLFSIFFALAILVPNVKADYGMAINTTPTQVQIKQTSSGSASFKLDVLANENFNNQSVFVMRLPSIAMNSAYSITGSHNFSCSGNTVAY